MFEKREYRIYRNQKRDEIYNTICDFWTRQGFYVTLGGPSNISGTSFQQKIGLKREIIVNLDQREEDTTVHLQFSAKISDEGIVGGAAAAVIFWPVAVVGGAMSYLEYEKDASNLMFQFWSYLDETTNKKGELMAAPGYPYPPPPPPSGQSQPPQPAASKPGPEVDPKGPEPVKSDISKPGAGTESPPEKLEETVACEECGEHIPKKWKACPHCGTQR